MLDASGLGVGQLYLDGTAHDASAPFSATLAPGQHYVYVTGYEENWFTVNADGTISYDAALEGAFSGAGTTSLAISGRAVALDASLLGVGIVYLDGVAHDATAPFTAHLLPGQHYVYVTSYEETWFTVNQDGTIAYDAALEGVFSGAGTTSLAISGRAVTLDASALGVTGLYVDGVLHDATAPFTVHLLPGRHYEYVTGYDMNWFTVNPNGTISYDAALEGALSGSGTTALTINGRAVTLDASLLGVGTVYLDGVAHDATAPFTASLLPGQHYLSTTGANLIWFTVNQDGTINYDPALDGTLSGRGSASLVLLAP
jgi:protein involved in polysaccharide export with SLBB domain